MKKIFGKILLFACFLAFLDQISKIFVVKYLATDYTLIENFLKFEYAENFGIAFGIKIPFLLLIMLNTVMLALILRIAFSEFKIQNRLTQFSIALIVGGALGNLIDRFTRGYVVDFIAIYKWPNFNLADMYISIGVLLLLLFYGKIKNSPPKAGKPS